MGYTPENNPYIPGDPYSYDLAWMVQEVKKAQQVGESAQASADAALQSQIEAQQAKDLSMAWAIGEDDGGPIPPGEPQYENNAKYYAEQAENSATAASNSETNAAASEINAAASELAARNYADNIGDPVSGIVTSWLTDHITNPSNPPVDTSLSVGGAAADAAATGSRIQELEDNFTAFRIYPLKQTDWELGSISSANGNNSAANYCIRTVTKHLIPDGMIISCPTGYRYNVAIYDAVTEVFQNTTGWLYPTNFYTFSGGQKYRLLFGPDPVDTTTTDIYDDILVGNEMATKLPLLSRYTPLFPQTNKNVYGDPIDLRIQKVYWGRTAWTLPPTSISPGLVSRQDIAISGGVIFQLYDADYVALINLSDGSVITHYAIQSGHGNSCQFSGEFDNPADEFPLLYCFEYTSNLVRVNKVDRTEATLKKTYKLDGISGYRFTGGVNEKGTRLYTLNYAVNSSQDPTNNYCKFTLWNLSTATVNLDGTYSPEIIASYNIPFIYMIQGCHYEDGKLYVACGGTGGTYTKGVIVLDMQGNIKTTLNYTYDSNEPEGVCIYKDSSDPEYKHLHFTSNRFFRIRLSI